jgi:hypothetical protein
MRGDKHGPAYYVTVIDFSRRSWRVFAYRVRRTHAHLEPAPIRLSGLTLLFLYLKSHPVQPGAVTTPVGGLSKSGGRQGLEPY